MKINVVKSPRHNEKIIKESFINQRAKRTPQRRGFAQNERKKSFDMTLTCSSIAVRSFSSFASRSATRTISRETLSRWVVRCLTFCSKSAYASPSSDSWVSRLAKSCFTSSKVRVTWWIVNQRLSILLETLLKWFTIWRDTSCRESRCSSIPSL